MKTILKISVVALSVALFSSCDLISDKKQDTHVTDTTSAPKDSTGELVPVDSTTQTITDTTVSATEGTN